MRSEIIRKSLISTFELDPFGIIRLGVYLLVLSIQSVL